MKARVAVLTVIGGAIALACFSERGSGPAVTSAECSVPVSVIDSMHFIVAIRDFSFQPDSIKVPVGATVTWVNCEDTGTEPHTTTSDSAAVWSSTDLNPGDRFSHTFATAGSFPYHCIPHEAFMHGKLVVQ